MILHRLAKARTLITLRLTLQLAKAHTLVTLRLTLHLAKAHTLETLHLTLLPKVLQLDIKSPPAAQVTNKSQATNLTPHRLMQARGMKLLHRNLHLPLTMPHLPHPSVKLKKTVMRKRRQRKKTARKKLPPESLTQQLPLLASTPLPRLMCILLEHTDIAHLLLAANTVLTERPLLFLKLLAPLAYTASHLQAALTFHS
jgi:hypothetical protein